MSQDDSPPSPTVDADLESESPHTLELASLPHLFAVPESTLKITETIIFDNSLSSSLASSTSAPWPSLSIAAVKLLQPDVAQNLRRLEILLFEGTFDFDLLPLPQLTHFVSRTDHSATGLDLLQLCGKLLGCERLASLELSLCGLGVSADEDAKGKARTKLGPAGSIGRMRFLFPELRELKLMTDDMETMEVLITTLACPGLETLKLEVERPARPPPSTADLNGTSKNKGKNKKSKKRGRSRRSPDIPIPDADYHRLDDSVLLKLSFGIERIIRGSSSTLTEFETNLWPRLWYEAFFADPVPDIGNSVGLALYEAQKLRSLTLTDVDWKDEKMVWFLEDLTLVFEEASGDEAEGPHVVLVSGKNASLTSITLRAPDDIIPDPEVTTNKRKATPSAESAVPFSEMSAALVTMLASRRREVTDGTRFKHSSGQSFTSRGLKTFETGAVEMRLLREHALECYAKLIGMWESGLGGFDLRSVAGEGARISCREK